MTSQRVRLVFLPWIGCQSTHRKHPFVQKSPSWNVTSRPKEPLTPSTQQSLNISRQDFSALTIRFSALIVKRNRENKKKVVWLIKYPLNDQSFLHQSCQNRICSTRNASWDVSPATPESGLCRQVSLLFHPGIQDLFGFCASALFAPHQIWRLFHYRTGIRQVVRLKKWFVLSLAHFHPVYKVTADFSSGRYSLLNRSSLLLALRHERFFDRWKD